MKLINMSEQTVEEYMKQLGENGDKIVGYAVVRVISEILNEAAKELYDNELIEITSQIEEHIELQLEKVLSQNIIQSTSGD